MNSSRNLQDTLVAGKPIASQGSLRAKRARIAPGDYVRCASTGATAEELLKKVATLTIHRGEGIVKNVGTLPTKPPMNEPQRTATKPAAVGPIAEAPIVVELNLSEPLKLATPKAAKPKPTKAERDKIAQSKATKLDKIAKVTKAAKVIEGASLQPLKPLKPAPAGPRQNSEPVEGLEKRDRGRPSKIGASARARLLGPPSRLVEISVMITTNYDSFIIPTGVFEPTEEEVRKLADRIEMRNELLWNPIRVTPYMEVYDGKLRLAAARLLGLEIAYMVDATLSVGHIIADRGEPRGWEFDQYCAYYAEQGRPDYLKVLTFAASHEIPVGSAASLLQGGGIAGTEEALKEFKFGRFKVTHEAHALQVVAVRDEYRRKLPKLGIKPKRDITQQRVFLNALSKQLALPDIHPDTLRNILAAIRWQPTEADYDRHLARLIRDSRRETASY